MRHLVLLCVLQFTAVIQASNPRSVNVALETVLEFDGNNDIAFIDTVQNFLNKLKTTITRNRERESDYNDTNKPKNVNREDKKFVFTNFLAETFTVLKSYKDDDLKAFFNTLGNEVKTWQTRKGNNITDLLGFKRIVDINLQDLQHSPADDIRRKLNVLSNALKPNNGHNLVTEFLNYLYKKESEQNLSNFLNKLKLYKRRTRRNKYTDINIIIRYGILSLIDPLLKLNSKTIKGISRFYNKYIANLDTDDNVSDVKKKKGKSKTQHRHSRNKIFNGNDVLDYIEDHLKIIDKRLSTLGIKSKIINIPKEVTSHKHITIRPATEVTTGRLEENILRPRDKMKKVHFSNADVSGREPVLINLNDDPDLRSIEEYLSTTRRHKSYRKSTKRKLTPKKHNLRLKTTKKFRKAFRTTAVSMEGLSIEHFGSLFGREYHRKVNDKDAFVHTELPSTLTVANDAFTRDMTDVSKEITSKRNLSREKVNYRAENHDELKNNSKNDEERSKSTEIIDEIPRKTTDSIKTQADIIIETTKATTVKTIETTTPKPVTTTKRSYNVSIVTKYFNIQTMKPTIYLRGHNDRDSSNETNSKTIPQTTSTLANVNKTDNINKKTNDGLENEIEGIMERFNSTPVEVELKNFIDNAQNSDEDKNVKDQMKADLARLLAPPTTKTTATVLFTDPFDDIDQAADFI